MFFIKDKIFYLKMFFQKVFRISHLSDCDIYNIKIPISKSILIKLKKFRKLKKYGHPSNFKNIEEWDETLDKMIFAFEMLKYKKGTYSLCYEEKQMIKLLKKYGVENPIDFNKVSYSYTINKNLDDAIIMEFVYSEKELEDKLIDGYVLYSKIKSYNKDKIKSQIIDEKVQEGKNLFCKYFEDLWD